VRLERNGILSSPFFLDAALRYNIEGHRRSQASERFLIAHGELKPAHLDRVAAAAFDAYERLRARVFDRAEFAMLAGEEATGALERSRTLITTSEAKSYFAHHLLHDYLAARHVARLPSELWTPRTLSIISFDASSFDAVELVFEQLQQQKADLFLRQIYDWNLYAAGYALAQEQDAYAAASKEMRAVIFAMLAEKRFDFILATRQRATDALAFMQLADAAKFREATSLDLVFKALDKVESNEIWFNEWRTLFSTTPQTELNFETFASIRSYDSIIGWTVANVAKRSTINEDASAALAQWVQDEINPTVRWRIAHALGAFPSRTSLDTLLQLLDNDPDGYVRYGSIRSIVELAARSNTEFQGTISDAIGTRAETISDQPRVLGELRTSLLVDPDIVTSEWIAFVQNIVRKMFSATDEFKERDLWRRRLYDAETLYTSRREDPGGSAPRKAYG
jgi:hypothetical protein